MSSSWTRKSQANSFTHPHTFGTVSWHVAHIRLCECLFLLDLWYKFHACHFQLMPISRSGSITATHPVWTHTSTPPSELGRWTLQHRRHLECQTQPPGPSFQVSQQLFRQFRPSFLNCRHPQDPVLTSTPPDGNQDLVTSLEKVRTSDAIKVSHHFFSSYEYLWLISCQPAAATPYPQTASNHKEGLRD